MIAQTYHLITWTPDTAANTDNVVGILHGDLNTRDTISKAYNMLTAERKAQWERISDTRLAQWEQDTTTARVFCPQTGETFVYVGWIEAPGETPAEPEPYEPGVFGGAHPGDDEDTEDAPAFVPAPSPMLAKAIAENRKRQAARKHRNSPAAAIARAEAAWDAEDAETEAERRMAEMAANVTLTDLRNLHAIHPDHARDHARHIIDTTDVSGPMTPEIRPALIARHAQIETARAWLDASPAPEPPAPTATTRKPLRESSFFAYQLLAGSCSNFHTDYAFKLATLIMRDLHGNAWGNDAAYRAEHERMQNTMLVIVESGDYATWQAILNAIACDTMPDALMPEPTPPAADCCASIPVKMRRQDDGNWIVWASDRRIVDIEPNGPAFDVWAKADMLTGERAVIFTGKSISAVSAWLTETFQLDIENLTPEPTPPAADVMAEIVDYARDMSGVYDRTGYPACVDCGRTDTRTVNVKYGDEKRRCLATCAPAYAKQYQAERNAKKQAEYASIPAIGGGSHEAATISPVNTDLAILRVKYDEMRATWARHGVTPARQDVAELIGNLVSRAILSDAAIDHIDTLTDAVMIDPSATIPAIGGDDDDPGDTLTTDAPMPHGPFFPFDLDGMYDRRDDLDARRRAGDISAIAHFLAVSEVEYALDLIRRFTDDAIIDAANAADPYANIPAIGGGAHTAADLQPRTRATSQKRDNQRAERAAINDRYHAHAEQHAPDVAAILADFGFTVISEKLSGETPVTIWQDTNPATHPTVEAEHIAHATIKQTPYSLRIYNGQPARLPRHGDAELINRVEHGWCACGDARGYAAGLADAILRLIEVPDPYMQALDAMEAREAEQSAPLPRPSAADLAEMYGSVDLDLTARLLQAGERDAYTIAAPGHDGRPVIIAEVEHHDVSDNLPELVLHGGQPSMSGPWQAPAISGGSQDAETCAECGNALRPYEQGAGHGTCFACQSARAHALDCQHDAEPARFCSQCGHDRTPNAPQPTDTGTSHDVLPLTQKYTRKALEKKCAEASAILGKHVEVVQEPVSKRYAVTEDLPERMRNNPGEWLRERDCNTIRYWIEHLDASIRKHRACISATDFGYQLVGDENKDPFPWAVVALPSGQIIQRYSHRAVADQHADRLRIERSR